MVTFDLEHVATAHHRFAARLRNELGAESLTPIMTRIIDPRLHTRGSNIQFPGTISCLKLVPGGRFLLSLSEFGVIQLWDLGFASNVFSSCQPIATATIANNDWADLWICPTLDGLGILVLMRTIPIHKCVSPFNAMTYSY
jgi:hypothetical protein